MKTKVKKRSKKKSFEKEYRAIMKDSVFPLSTPQQWMAQGDTFVKFSLYKGHPTTATPHTQG